MAAEKKRSPRLGRGLSSLMSSPVKVHPSTESSEAAAAEAEGSVASGEIKAEEGVSGGRSVADKQRVGGSKADAPSRTQEQAGLTYLPVSSLQPNRHQPRQRFDEAALKRLADSIASEGVMQPIVARSCLDQPGRYEVVAGERRWRAAQLAGLVKMPVIVRNLNDRQIAEWALIENLQREDLNPIERAEAFSRLIEQFGLSHEEAGARVGMDRSSISNHLRLLVLSDTVKDMLGEGLLSMGQARALLGLSDSSQQQALAERAVRQGLSVREVEAEVRKITSEAAMSVKSTRQAKAPFLADLEKQIAEQLGTKVAIKSGRKKGSGTLSIEFYSLDQFDSLVSQLGVKTD